MSEFTEAQIHRYARHILLPEVGGTGQQKLLDARVLVVGAGGLGSPLILYLAAAGVGTIGIIDPDTVDLSNLQRQIAHTTDRIGTNKVDSAARAARAINPEIVIEAYPERLTANNALAIIAKYDVVADGTDNFAARFLLNDACYFAKKPLVSAAILRFDGQLATWKPYDGGPCYRCLFPAPPPDGEVPSCSEAGILGSVAGTLGTLQATEVIKEIIGIGESAAGWLLIYEALDLQFRRVRIKPDPHCALCGTHPTITGLA